MLYHQMQDCISKTAFFTHMMDILFFKETKGKANTDLCLLFSIKQHWRTSSVCFSDSNSEKQYTVSDKQNEL